MKKRAILAVFSSLVIGASLFSGLSVSAEKAWSEEDLLPKWGVHGDMEVDAANENEPGAELKLQAGYSKLVTTEHSSGEKGLEFSQGGNGWVVYGTFAKDDYADHRGKKYKLEVMIKTNTTSEKSGKLVAMVDQGALLAELHIAGGTKDWTKYAIEFTVPADLKFDDEKKDYFKFGYEKDGSAGSVWIDDMKLFEEVEVTEPENPDTEEPEEPEPDESMKRDGDLLNGLFEADNYTELRDTDEANGFKKDETVLWSSLGKEAVTVDDTTAKTGTKSFKIAHDKAGVSGLFLLADVKPGETYTLKAWIKTKDLEKPAEGTMDAARIGVIFPKEDGSDGKETMTDFRLSGTNDWKLIDLEFKVPAGCTQVKLAAQLWENKTGTVWFDDIALYEGTAEENKDKNTDGSGEVDDGKDSVNTGVSTAAAVAVVFVLTAGGTAFATKSNRKKKEQ